jgi:hypothetical protein
VLEEFTIILVDGECVGVRDTEGSGVVLKLAGLAVRVRVRVRVAVAAIVPVNDIRSRHAKTAVAKRMRMFQGAQGEALGIGAWRWWRDYVKPSQGR